MSDSTGNFLIGKFLETETNQTNEIQINLSNNHSDSKEDLVSEAGTYTIDEKADRKGNQEETTSNALPFKSIDLMSARAAIDETFGIVDRPESIINDAESTTDKEEVSISQTTPGSKRQPIKMVRERNMTYSLTHDVFKLNNQNGDDENNDQIDLNQTASLTKTKTYDIIAHNQDLLVDTGDR